MFGEQPRPLVCGVLPAVGAFTVAPPWGGPGLLPTWPEAGALHGVALMLDLVWLPGSLQGVTVSMDCDTDVYAQDPPGT